MIRLTDEEIETIVRKEFPIFELKEEDEGDRKDTIDRLLKAQLKKVAEWGSEPCPHAFKPKHSKDIWIKRECSECWQALLEEVK